MTVSVAAAPTGNLVAPSPLPHQLSRQPSKEDLELAANLNLLNNSESRHTATADNANKRSSEPRRDLLNGAQGNTERARQDSQKRRESDTTATVTVTVNAAAATPKEGSPAAHSVASSSLQEQGQAALTTPVAGQTCRSVSGLPCEVECGYASSASKKL